MEAFPFFRVGITDEEDTGIAAYHSCGFPEGASLRGGARVSEKLSRWNCIENQQKEGGDAPYNLSDSGFNAQNFKRRFSTMKALWIDQPLFFVY